MWSFFDVVVRGAVVVVGFMKFYVWKEDEIKALLGKDADLMMDYYNVSGVGFWEHGVNILLKNENDARAHFFSSRERRRCSTVRHTETAHLAVEKCGSSN